MHYFYPKQSSVVAGVLISLVILTLTLGAFAQSRDLSFPTPVTTNEISGTIRARDIGDSRSTSYFYTFDGDQGDVFINVVTKNFSGDIDVFIASSLVPLTKMVLYADSGSSETGRVIYMRKSERLVLRVEGRSPNDDPAAFRIKFAGSFIALKEQKRDESAEAPRVSGSESSPVSVNSVGTIIETAPKPKPTPANVATETETKRPERSAESIDKKGRTAKEKAAGETAVKETAVTGTDTEPETKPVRVVETDPYASKEPEAKPTETAAAKTVPKAEPKPKPLGKARATGRTVKPPARVVKPPVEPVEKKPDPLASIRLVIELKDGTVIERPMNEVSKFSVDKGVLNVLLKDGTIGRYSILDVSKVTIQ